MGPVDYYRDSAGIGQLILNRPQALNALNWEAMEAFQTQVGAAARDRALRVLIVRGHGRAFCAGGDLFELHNYPTRADGERLSAVMTDALNQLEQLPVPTIAALEGPAMGGGAEIALACDLRVMADDATLGLMHIRLAITPAWGGAARLVRIVGYPRALEWSLIGTILTAEVAERAGIASQIVGHGQAAEAAFEIAGQMLANDAQALADIKRLMRSACVAPGEAAGQLEREIFADRWASDAHLEASEKFVRSRRQSANGRDLGPPSG